MTLEILALAPQHRDGWQRLAEGYRDFYNTQTTAAEYDQAWRKVLAAEEVHGLGASIDGQLVGIAHFLFHGSTWAPRVCYLQDLFTAPAARGQGVARRLIEAVAAQARERNCARYYWLTQESNATARQLYDRVARFNGFIRYDVAL